MAGVSEGSVPSTEGDPTLDIESSCSAKATALPKTVALAALDVLLRIVPRIAHLAVLLAVAISLLPDGMRTALVLGLGHIVVGHHRLHVADAAEHGDSRAHEEAQDACDED